MIAKMRALGPRDLDDMASVHMAAFPESALSKLGQDAVRRYYDWQMTGPHDSLSLGAYLEGALVGFFVGGSFRGSLSGFVKRNRVFLALRVITRPWLVAAPDFQSRLRLGARMLRARPASPQTPASAAARIPSFGILSICTHPAARRKGVGEALMAEAERQAVARGFNRLHLTVHASNAGAIRLYERLGWSRQPDSVHWSADSVTFAKLLGPAGR